MTHFGLLCPAATGHLNPMTTLGYELKQRGHPVTLVGMLDAQAKTQAAGLDFQAIGESAFPLGAMANSLSELGQLSGLEAFRYTIDLFKQQTVVRLEEAPAANGLPLKRCWAIRPTRQTLFDCKRLFARPVGLNKRPLLPRGLSMDE